MKNSTRPTLPTGGAGFLFTQFPKQAIYLGFLLDVQNIYIVRKAQAKSQIASGFFVTFFRFSEVISFRLVFSVAPFFSAPFVSMGFLSSKSCSKAKVPHTFKMM